MLKKINIKNCNNNFYYKILRCGNGYCETFSFTKRKKCLSYLPKLFADNKIKNDLETIKKRSIFCKEHWIDKGHSEENAKKEISIIESANSKKRKKEERFIPSKENLRKIGYNEEKINEICSTPTQIKFWVKKGFSEKDAKKKVIELQKNNASKFKEKIEKSPWMFSAYTSTQTAYWINKRWDMVI